MPGRVGTIAALSFPGVSVGVSPSIRWALPKPTSTESPPATLTGTPAAFDTSTSTGVRGPGQGRLLCPPQSHVERAGPALDVCRRRARDGKEQARREEERR